MLYNILSINQLNQIINELLYKNLSLVWVRGEIASINIASSGHWYFILKDSQSQIKAVMFKNKAMYSILPKIGEQIEVLANVEIYASRGDIQLIIESLRPVGEGALHEAFLATKNKLEKLGIFEPSNKKLIPKTFNKVGIITSLEAAALQDVIKTMQLKVPFIEIYIYPCLVQGILASKTIIEQIDKANQAKAENKVDALIICRGGGSKQDLASYNDEELAINIFNSEIPIISAVGHETDITIADMASSARAATPTASVDLLGISYLEKINLLHLLQHTIKNNTFKHLQQARYILKTYSLNQDKLLNKLHKQQLRLSYLRQNLYQKFNNKLQSLYIIQDKYKKLIEQKSPYKKFSNLILTNIIDNKIISNVNQLNIDKEYYLYFMQDKAKIKIKVQEVINENIVE